MQEKNNIDLNYGRNFMHDLQLSLKRYIIKVEILLIIDRGSDNNGDKDYWSPWWCSWLS